MKKSVMCYSSCKHCYGYGDSSKHNCYECWSSSPNKVNKSSYIDCYSTCPTDYSKLVPDRKECINKCENDETHKYELNNRCYITCPSGTYPKENQLMCLSYKPEGYYLNSSVYKKCYETCKNCYGYGNEENHNCSECSTSYPYVLTKSGAKNCYVICPIETYPIENQFYCYTEKPEGYYLNLTVYKKCYGSCKNCNGYGNSDNHNCYECKSVYPCELIRIGYKNCYSTCSNYFYLDKSSNIKYCTESPICPLSYKKLILDKKQCVKSCLEDRNYKYEFNNKCYITCPSGSYPKEYEYLCFTEKPEGFYFKSPNYKSCYVSCRNCNGYGDSDNHNCTECNTGYPYEVIKNGSRNCYIKCPYYFYFDKNINIKICTENLTCPSDYQKLVYRTNECVKKCEEDEIYKYELDNICYKTCPGGTYPIENKYLCLNEKPEGYYLDSTIYKNCYYTCKNCNGYGNSYNHNCIECNSNYPYAQITAGAKNCYNSCPSGTFRKESEYLCLNEKPEGYYLDSTIYRKCYESCNKCNRYGDSYNHNCNECKVNYPYILNKNGYKNCYRTCPNYFYIDKSTNTKYCTENPTCPSNFKKLISKKSECVKKCEEDDVYKYELNNICYKTCPGGTYKKEDEYLCFSGNQEGYYFDSTIYKKCYRTCSNCYGYGNEEYHNCSECNIGYPIEIHIADSKNCYNDCPYYYYISRSSYNKYCTESLICPSNYNKLISEKSQCINKCEDDDNYKYELNNQCYITCPSGTYPKENEYLCLTEKPGGYHLDSTIYKKCYRSCKNCNGIGNENNNKCTECKDDYPYELIRTDYKNCYSTCPHYFYLDKRTNIKYCTENRTCPLDYTKLISERSECLNRCEEDGTYRYESNNKCYRSCPSGSYPMENEYSCLKGKQEGYYLGSTKYKKCYESCKNCNGYGDSNNHNCNECKSDYPCELIRIGYKNCYNTCPNYFYLDKNTNIKYCTESPICPSNYSKLISNKNECINKCEDDDNYKYEFISKRI